MDSAEGVYCVAPGAAVTGLLPTCNDNQGATWVVPALDGADRVALDSGRLWMARYLPKNRHRVCSSK